MEILNPLIRNALLTALHAVENYYVSETARMFVGGVLESIPDYWERPVLTKEYRKTLHALQENPAGIP